MFTPRAVSCGSVENAEKLEIHFDSILAIQSGHLCPPPWRNSTWDKGHVKCVFANWKLNKKKKLFCFDLVIKLHKIPLCLYLRGNNEHNHRRGRANWDRSEWLRWKDGTPQDECMGEFHLSHLHTDKWMYWQKCHLSNILLFPAGFPRMVEHSGQKSQLLSPASLTKSNNKYYPAWSEPWPPQTLKYI